MAEQLNVRIPESTEEQIEQLREWTGMTQTQLVIQAIDRLYQSTKADREANEPFATLLVGEQEVEAVNMAYAASDLQISNKELRDLIKETKIAMYMRGYGPGRYIIKEDLEKLKRAQSAKE